MKTKILLLTSFFILTTSIAYPATLTVSNHPFGGAQYTNLIDAYNAAANGDILILEGTNIPYNLDWNHPLNKSLTIMGAGVNTNKQFFKKTIINDAFRIYAGANGSSIHGITFQTAVSMNASTNNILFEDCEFVNTFNTNNTLTTNLTIRNCFFSYNNYVNLYLNSSVSSSILISNCVFNRAIQGYNNSLNTIVIENCLFLSTSAVYYGLQYASINNCIFMNSFPTGSTSCIYLNNICRVAGTFPPAGNTGSGNIDNTDPNLVSYTLGQPYSSSDDYHLQSGSPCIGAGIGGTDIGVYGGTSNFSGYGEPLIAPVVRSMQINNTTVAPNGTLDVVVEASKPITN